MKIVEDAKGRDVDIIHSHGYKSNILIGLLPKKIRRLPIVTTIHGWTNVGGITRLQFYEWLDIYSLRFIDAVVLVNKSMSLNQKVKKISQKKIFVVENGIPFKNNNLYAHEFKQTQIPKKKQIYYDQAIVDFCSKGYTIGSIGRLSPEKGFKNLLDAIKIASTKVRDIRLVIIGEGSEREALEDKVRKLGLRERVLIPGYRHEARKYLPCFDVFAVSSLTEGLPITILEAIQAGVPIVSTMVGGIPEVLRNGKAGLLVESSNAEVLAKGICKVSENIRLRDSICESVKKIDLQIYSSERMTKEYLSIYKQIISAGRHD